MSDREEDDLQMALRMSLQGCPPEAKRIKPRDNADESPEMRNRRAQRQLMAAAAEKRIRAAENRIASPAKAKAENLVPSVLKKKVEEVSVSGEVKVEEVEMVDRVEEEGRDSGLGFGEVLSREIVDELFFMVFGSDVSRDILAQWSNQGTRFSSDTKTHMGLVQHEGGPCGVLATIQVPGVMIMIGCGSCENALPWRIHIQCGNSGYRFVLKCLLFVREDLGNSPLQSLGGRKNGQTLDATEDDLASVTEDRKARALVHSMVEILFMCGGSKRTVIATLDVFSHHTERRSENGQKNEMIAKSLEGLSTESASDFHSVLRVKTYTSLAAAFKWLMFELPVFQSRMGAMLFLLSALPSRGLESIQADRDDPSLPLVTAPFGHSSQRNIVSST